jgi:DNA-binding transcriptional MerR regulator
MSRRRPGTLRIGELAAQTGLTPATIRYYEQIGLLPGGVRPHRSHRIYTEADVDRLDHLRRLRDLLGVSLEELQEMAAAEETAAALPARIGNTTSAADRLFLVDEALRQADGVLHHVRARQIELEELEQELAERRHEIEATPITSF